MNPRTRRQRKRRRAERAWLDLGPNWIIVTPRQPIAVRLVSTRGAVRGSILRQLRQVQRGARWVRIPSDLDSRTILATVLRASLPWLLAPRRPGLVRPC